VFQHAGSPTGTLIARAPESPQCSELGTPVEAHFADRKVYVLKGIQLFYDNSYHAAGHVKKGQHRKSWADTAADDVAGGRQ